MPEKLPAPKPIPKDEWLKSEIKRGATFPQSIVPLTARIKTPEQHYVYEQLAERAEKLAAELFDRWPEPWNLSREELNELALHRDFRPQFLQMAAEAAYLADSYRNFDVGAVVIGYQDTRIDEPGRLPYHRNGKINPWRVLFDANTRQATDEKGTIIPRHPHETAEYSHVRKYCAELYLTDRIDPSKPEHGSPEEKLTKAVALYLAGEAQIDNDSEVSQITLTSCKLCRDRFWKKTLSDDDDGNLQIPVYEPEMPVISADIRNLSNWKAQPINDLHRFHKEGLPRSHREV